MGKGLVSDSVILVPVLINFEGLGASLNTREGSREDVYFPLFPFKDNFIKSLCFHSGLNMGRLNGKVIISPRLLMERGGQGKGGTSVRGNERPQPYISTESRTHTQVYMCVAICTHTHIQPYLYSHRHQHPQPFPPTDTYWHKLFVHRKIHLAYSGPNTGTSGLANPPMLS